MFEGIKKFFKNEEPDTAELDGLKERNSDLNDKNNKLQVEVKLLKKDLEIANAFKTKIVNLLQDDDFVKLKRIVQVEVEDIGDIGKKAIEAFESALNSNSQECRGGCVIRKPGSKETESKTFASRKEANELLGKFKSGELVLVQ